MIYDNDHYRRYVSRTIECPYDLWLDGVFPRGEGFLYIFAIRMNLDYKNFEPFSLRSMIHSSFWVLISLVTRDLDLYPRTQN